MYVPTPGFKSRTVARPVRDPHFMYGMVNRQGQVNMSGTTLHSSLSQDLAAITGCAPPQPSSCGSASVSVGCSSVPSSLSSTTCSVSSSPTTSSVVTTSAPCTPVSTTTNTGTTTQLERQVVQAGNILQSIQLIEGQIYEIAQAIVDMNTDVSDIEQKLVRRILDSLVEN